MKETEGAWGPWGAVAGGIAGAWGYLGYASACGCESSWGGFWGSAGAGAAAGFVAGPVGVAEAFAVSSIGYYSGMAGGFVERGYSSLNR